MFQEPNEDLFESTKMTFGEHLEELRGALFRAVLGLTIGTMISLMFANHVVEWIEVPLRAALDRFYTQQTLHKLKEKYGSLDTRLEKQITVNNLQFEMKYLERQELRRLLGMDEAAEKSKAQEAPATSAPSPSQLTANEPSAASNEARPETLDDWVPIRMWTYQENRISAFSVSEVFMIWMKAGLVSGFILASPWIFLQIWGFVAAGLYPHEKNYVYTFLPISLILFLSGAALAYFFVFKYVLDFLFSFNLMVRIDPEPRISEWLSFVLLLPLGFGLSFQLPLVMFVLERVGIVTIGLYLDKWRIAVLVIFIIAMILTPAEPISMLMMAIPLTFLYFAGIGMCKWMPRAKSPFGDVTDPI